MKKRKLKKNSGTASMILFVMFTFILILFMSSVIFAKFKLVTESEMLHDRLVSSNLAAFTTKNIDLNLLSKDPTKKQVMFKNPNDAYMVFQKHLKINLSMLGKVDIKNFTIYNVDANTGNITIYTLNPSTGGFNISNSSLNQNPKTPKGNTVKYTTIHSEIGFNIQTIFNKKQYVSISEDNHAYRR